MIPKSITREHVLSALADIQSGEIPIRRESTKFDLVHNDHLYPPKYTLSTAAKYATGKELPPSEFSGGQEANEFLTNLGFEIRPKKDWTERECYFAVWGYDQLDVDRSIVKNHLYSEIADITGRSTKSVEWKIQNVSRFDTRPRNQKPIAEAPNAQKLIGDVFQWYWKDREAARRLFDSYLEESTFSRASGVVFTNKIDDAAHKTVIIEEGAEGLASTKIRKRSAKLVAEGRKYFRGLEPDGRLHCHACGFAKPDSVEQEIVQLHHTDMISEVDKRGKKISLEDAIRRLVPLCPTCHQLAHTSRPPLSAEAVKRLKNQHGTR
jgi:predicted HNH restriction endonuclease